VVTCAKFANIVCKKNSGIEIAGGPEASAAGSCVKLFEASKTSKQLYPFLNEFALFIFSIFYLGIFPENFSKW